MLTLKLTQSRFISAIQTNIVAKTAGKLVAGSLFLALISQIEVPFYPVPMTLQTLGLFLLAIWQGGWTAAGSVLLYLVEASCGLPVLHGGISNPLWMIGPTAGYLVGFPIAAFVIGSLTEGKVGFIRTSAAIALGEAVIYLLGASWLATFVGYENALSLGVAPFLFGSLLKLLIAASVKARLLKN
jgi:biotin transport system substrate-specific component